MWIQVNGDRYRVTHVRRWREASDQEMSTELKLDKPLKTHLTSIIEDASEGFLVGLVLLESSYLKYKADKES